MRGRGRVVAVCVLLLLGGSVATSAVAGAIPGAACTHPIQVSRLAFGPGTVHRGETSTARLAGRNCTRHARTVTITWSGQFKGHGAVGCPAIDPFPQTVSVPGAKALAAHVAYTVSKDCGATQLIVTTRVTDASHKVISNKTATLRIVQK